jgi:hypothetical protein
MVFGDRLPSRKTKEKQVTQPLHTDDPNAEGNLNNEEYQRLFEERAASVGDDGLHVVPQEILDAIEGGEDGADR